MSDSSQQSTLEPRPELDLRHLPKPTKRQMSFIEAYLDPTSDTFGNAYQSAVRAGFSDKTSRVITANSRNTPWIQQIKDYLTRYEPEHIYRAIQHIATHTKYDRDKLKALELMGKHSGMFVDRVQSDVNVRFVNSVPRPRVVLDVTPPTPD